MKFNTTHLALPIISSIGFFVIGCSSNSHDASTASNGHASAQTAALSVPGVQRTSTAVDGIRSMRDELTKTRETISATSKALEDLSTSKGDLLEPFNRFMTHRDALDQEDQRLGELSEGMRARARDYITNWEVEVYGVEDANLRKQAESRRSEVRKNYQQIADSSRATRDSLQAYRKKKLASLNTFLANDLTTSGVRAASTSVREATQSATEVQQKIDGVTAELDRVMHSMTPSVTQPDASSSPSLGEGK